MYAGRRRSGWLWRCRRRRSRTPSKGQGRCYVSHALLHRGQHLSRCKCWGCIRLLNGWLNIM
eukprot:6188130-Pleurochrysis_carterae.AAC.1